MERLFDSAKALPSIPRVMHDVLLTLNSNDVDVEQISKPLSLDPALSAKVLRLANSAHFGLPRQVGSIDDAIMLVGFEAVRTLVIASGLVGCFTAPPGFDMHRFWRLSVLSGLIAKDIAKSLHQPQDLAYTAALMHGLGILSIHAVFPEAAASIESVCSHYTATERAAVERDRLGFHHGDVGAEIAHRWKLPTPIAQAIRYYPQLDHTDNNPLADIVQCAVSLAMDLDNGISSEVWGHYVPEATARLQLRWDDIRHQADYWAVHREAAEQIVA